MVYITDRNIFGLLPTSSVLAIQKHDKDQTAILLALGDITAKGNLELHIDSPKLEHMLRTKYQEIQFPLNDPMPFYIMEDDDIFIVYFNGGDAQVSQIKVVAAREFFNGWLGEQYEQKG